MKLIHANVGVLLVVMLLVVPITAWAQGAANDERTYGTTALTNHTVGAWAFTGISAGDTAAMNGNDKGSRYCSGVSCTFVASVLLPEGALIQVIGISACNTNPDPAATVTFSFRRFPLPEGPPLSIPGTFVIPSNAGCGNFLESQLAFGETINNQLYTYQLQVTMTGTSFDQRLRFSAVTLQYTLQVSPAPARATFTDVQTNHIFFPFIEALVAAGITNGCSTSPPMFCPDNFVTRGQMAKFISEALGLQFAP